MAGVTSEAEMGTARHNASAMRPPRPVEAVRLHVLHVRMWSCVYLFSRLVLLACVYRYRYRYVGKLLCHGLCVPGFECPVGLSV